MNAPPQSSSKPRMKALDSDTRVRLLRGILLTLCGAVVLGIALVNVQSTRELVRTGLRVQGSVATLAAGTSHPRVEFEDPSGQKIDFAANGFVSHRAGERVVVLFDARDPLGTAVLDESGALWFFDVLSALLGMLMIAMGFYSMLRLATKQEESE
jgi:Protein of unknown function (DUF3592)